MNTSEETVRVWKYVSKHWCSGQKGRRVGTTGRKVREDTCKSGPQWTTVCRRRVTPERSEPPGGTGEEDRPSFYLDNPLRTP